MPEILELKAKHFKGAPYDECDRCPVANAAKDHFNCDEVLEYVNSLSLVDRFNGIATQRRYLHNPYNTTDFLSDRILAFKAGYDDTVIRVITLTEPVKKEP